MNTNKGNERRPTLYSRLFAVRLRNRRIRLFCNHEWIRLRSDCGETSRDCQSPGGKTTSSRIRTRYGSIFDSCAFASIRGSSNERSRSNCFATTNGAAFARTVAKQAVITKAMADRLRIYTNK